jgi:predicted dehydrogenase
MLMSPHSSSTRRDFIKAAGLGTAALTLNPLEGLAAAGRSLRQGRMIDPGRKLNIACIGCGGKGLSDVSGVSTENIVALCDVDPANAQKIYTRYPDVPKYQDYRKMLGEMDDKIDAVTISTPDHMHYAAGLLAISLGKHVFIQKPLTRSVWEARELTLAARRHQVVTQMGNQGHAGEGVRLVREWVQAGLIGPVREVHIWTKKMEIGPYKSDISTRPGAGEQPPETLDWNLWLGTSPYRPYSIEYHPRKWRNWWDFGCGALGDIGCHTMDAAFYALDLGAPRSIQAESAPFGTETFPDWSVITYDFPPRGSLPPAKVVWYDGGKLPMRPRELEEERPFEQRYGYLLVGDKGTIYDPSEKCSSPRLIPEARMRSGQLPAKTLPRVPDGDPFQEWINACKGGPKPGSNFDYAGPLTEMVVLGNVALHGRGKKLEWDAARLRIPNAPEFEKHLRFDHRAF